MEIKENQYKRLQCHPFLIVKYAKKCPMFYGL